MSIKRVYLHLLFTGVLILNIVGVVSPARVSSAQAVMPARSKQQTLKLWLVGRIT